MQDLFGISKSDRWPPLEAKVVKATYENVEKLLTESTSEPDKARAQILESTALQIIRLANEPRLTSQADHPTCTMGSLEYYYWKKFPDEASRLIAESVLNHGKFVTGDGTTIKLTDTDMKPEAQSLEVPHPFGYEEFPPRSYASQVFQMMAPNIYWQRQTTDLTGRYTPQGSITYRMSKTGDELVKKSWGSHFDRLDDGPYVATAKILEDIGHQIGGPRTVPNVIEWGTQFPTREDFVSAILAFNHEPVIVAIDIDNWNDRTKPAKYTSHAITIDGVAPGISTALYHNTHGRFYDHPVSITKLYEAFPK